MSRSPLLRRVDAENLMLRENCPLDIYTVRQARAIVEAVRSRGETAVRQYAEQFGERQAHEPLVLGPTEMKAALAEIGRCDRQVLERAAGRIEQFALAQRDSISDVVFEIPGGSAGHTIEAVSAAGCYAPAGRYPLPSSVLMTAVTARVAGCSRVVVASPGARTTTLAAAAIAEADEFLAVGGAHAIAAFAYGFPGFDRCDVIAGPGNKWVTAAKHIVSSVVGIDMLAGPSELLILADESADPALIATDLLAQAEHDVDAVPMLITTSDRIADHVESELKRQLDALATSAVAVQALRNGFVATSSELQDCIDLVNRIAPEHLEIMTDKPDSVGERISNAGAIFIGGSSAEVVGDYGAGPNHTLPTGGTARFQAGLSVMQFLRLRTWLRLDDLQDADSLLEDAMRIAKIEGLEGHAKSAADRRIRSRHTHK